MKILVFAPYYPPHLGGLENYAAELNDKLEQKGNELIVFTPNLPASVAQIEVRGKITVIHFPAFEIISNYPLPKFWTVSFWSMLRSLFKQDFDVVLSHTRFFNTSLLALAYAKTKKIPWIHLEHGSAFVQLSSRSSTFVAKMYDLTFGALVFRHSTSNIAISKAVSRFIQKFDARESTVIYRGLNLDEITSAPEDLELKNRFPGKIIIAYTGRLYKWKGVENTIQAVLSLPQDIKDKIIFLIAGDGEDFDSLKKYSDESILMLGSIPREKVFGLLKIADIYVHSALPGGGLSTSLLEAMFCKCAVIATPNEGADEVITDKKTGLLIGESSSELIREKIIELINDAEARNKYASEAKLLIQESFSWDIGAQKCMDFFEKIIADKK